MKKFKFGAIKFKTCSSAARYFLKTTKLNQTEIARKIGTTPALVCQIAGRVRAKKSYQPFCLGAVRFKTRGDAARYYLRNSKLSQSAIARKVRVTPAFVCQLASKMIKEKV